MYIKMIITYQDEYALVKLVIKNEDKPELGIHLQDEVMPKSLSAYIKK